MTGADGSPLAGAVLDVWHADAEGFYSGFHPDLPAGIFRGKVIADEEGRYEVNTILRRRTRSRTTARPARWSPPATGTPGAPPTST